MSYLRPEITNVYQLICIIFWVRATIPSNYVKTTENFGADGCLQYRFFLHQKSH
jgi:hypothetical protein